MKNYELKTNGDFETILDVSAEEIYTGPFVIYNRAEKTYHVGDCDNHEIFSNKKLALEYCKKSFLTGSDLRAAKRAANDDTRDNNAAEYFWNLAARCQYDAIKNHDQSGSTSK